MAVPRSPANDSGADRMRQSASVGPDSRWSSGSSTSDYITYPNARYVGTIGRSQRSRCTNATWASGHGDAARADPTQDRGFQAAVCGSLQTRMTMRVPRTG